MEFRSLKDAAADPRTSGALAHCLACQKTLGKVAMLQQLALQQTVTQDGAGEVASGFFSGARLKYVADAVMSRSSSDGVPPGVLKPGTSVPTLPTAAKKPRTRGQTLRTVTDEETTSTRVDDCRVMLFGGICCVSPCQAPESRIVVAPAAANEGYSSQDSGFGGGNTVDSVVGKDHGRATAAPQTPVNASAATHG